MLKISKSHHLSQNRNSCIFCLLRKGTGPEGSICIIEMALRCHKQRCSRTDVNGIKIIQLIFLMSHLFFSPTFDVSHLFIEGKVGKGKVQKQILVILSWDRKGRDLSYYYLESKNNPRDRQFQCTMCLFLCMWSITFTLLNFSNKNVLLST